MPLMKIRGQRRKHVAGDVFALQLDDASYRFGHCFYDASDEGYVDENDNALSGRVEPCGWFALTNFEHFQHEVDEALAGRPVHGVHPKST
ncbi:hypothetical protein [Streptomyces sp. Je 1-332]|uniref:hypothetical protein n=1 Tax=Streptomyces sp. Je 1-332 TaxID=3231270 RepID=UPI0034589EF5